MKTVFAALLLVGGIAGYYWLAANTPLAFGMNEAPEPQSIVVVAYGYCVTLAGVILGALYRELQAMKARGEQQIGSIGRFLRGVFLSVDFWISACGSPIVYALLWKSLEGGSRSALTIVALQNGFCCTMILDSIMRKGDPSAPAKDKNP